MSEKILWRSNTGWHDWRYGAPLYRLLAEATRLGLIGRANRVEPAKADPAPLLLAQSGEELAKAILAMPPTRRDITEILVAGSDPAPWELYWNVYPFDAESGELDGFNTLWLTFDRSRVSDREASEALREAFMTACSATDTEYAMIHPYTHWSDFADKYYEVPVTINLQFKGVFWANFLGPGHLNEFDRAKLADLDAHQARWVDGNGLFVIATPDLASADAPDSEGELLRLTQRFRDALRPDSRWSRRR